MMPVDGRLGVSQSAACIGQKKARGMGRTGNKDHNGHCGYSGFGAYRAPGFKPRGAPGGAWWRLQGATTGRLRGAYRARMVRPHGQ